VQEDTAVSAVVVTQHGLVRGHRADGVFSFKGISYAAPPFGVNRFRSPQPVESWSGIRDALTFGPKSPQPMYPPQIALLLNECVDSGQDCLTLNVWSRDLGSSRQPVMVWIPGGMFAYHGTGGSPWYDGGRFARDGVVCVTINYRVGPDGFLFMDEESPNRGLLDQIAALEWVHENVAAFGGDPDNVTIFGESAGAMSVSTLLAMPCAEGLFRRAIAQSGAAQHVSSPTTARRVGQCLAERLDVEASLDAISAVPIDRLLRAQTELEMDLAANPDPNRWGAEVALTMLPWEPVIDGTVIPSHPMERLVAGAGTGIDIMIGTNSDEHRLFLVPSGAIDRITDEALLSVLKAYGLPPYSMMAAYHSARPSLTAGDVLAAVRTDWNWRIPAMQLADAHARSSADTYMYEFAWCSPQFNGRLGACHALEIPFVFDTLGIETEPLWGADPPQRLADIMHAAWVAFATHGDPGWPRYDLHRRPTMRFDTDCKVVWDPHSAERALWSGRR
jgi:para-nitrobenzyl esterase